MKPDFESQRRLTQCVHFRPCPDDPFHANSTPIYQTATFAQESATSFGPYDYSRSGNPTRAVLEEQLARLESAERAFAFSSGMSALTALTCLVPAGGHILAGDDLYGGTYRLLERVAPRSGLRASFADATDLERFAAAFEPQTRLVLVETPTNPLQRIADLRELAKLAHERGALLAVDNSLMSPYLQRPLELGADVVVHSATKHLSGHGDVTAGALAVRDEVLAGDLAFLQNAEGSALGPFDSWLLLRGMKTLGLRLEHQQRSALALARFLELHPLVERVHYPALAGHPGRELHLRQASGGGSVISFETGSSELSRALVEAARLFTISVSFGSVGSLISLPCRMSHSSIPAQVRQERALPDDLVRLSIGIEDVEDLLADLERALSEAAPRARRGRPLPAENPSAP
jgi:cysteine-S-conjugate beta-lyase